MENENKATNLGKLSLDLVKRLNPQDSDNLNTDAGNIASNKGAEIPDPYSFLNPSDFAPQIEVPEIIMPNYNYLELTLDQVRIMSTDDLLMLLSGEKHDGSIHSTTIQLIGNELLSRQIKESSQPHWTVYLGVVLAFIAAAASVIAIIK